MKLKFIESKQFNGWYHIEEDFRDTNTHFHELLGFIFSDEFGINWKINNDYSGIIKLSELKQITDFMENMEVSK